VSGKPWIPFIAFAVLCLVIGGAIAGTALSQTFIFFSGMLFVAAIVAALLSRRSKYDLAGLREFHEQEEIRQLEVDDCKDGDSFLCLCCGTAYSNRFPTCPKCSTRQC
jgi:hypothetical protein